MTKQRKLLRKDIMPLLTLWKHRLGLSDWLVIWEIQDFSSDDDVLAHTTASKDDMRAKITFRSDLHEKLMGTGMTIRSIVIHELLHVKLAHLVNYAELMALEMIGGVTGDQVRSRIHDENERLVDNLAICIDGWADQRNPYAKLRGTKEMSWPN